MQYSTSILERCVAPGIVEFTKANIPDVASEFPRSTYWIQNHFLNTTAGQRYPDALRHYYGNLIRRAQLLFTFYSKARSSTLAYLDGNQPDNPRVGLYYEAVGLWEVVALNLGIFTDLIKKVTGKNLFETGDSSPEERVYAIQNRVKHHAADIHAGTLAGTDVLPMWLTNDGFQTKSTSLDYAELAELVREVGRVADDLQNPRKKGATGRESAPAASSTQDSQRAE